MTFLPVFTGLMDISCTLMFQPLIGGQENLKLARFFFFFYVLQKFVYVYNDLKNVAKRT